ILAVPPRNLAATRGSLESPLPALRPALAARRVPRRAAEVVSSNGPVPVARRPASAVEEGVLDLSLFFCREPVQAGIAPSCGLVSVARRSNFIAGADWFVVLGSRCREAARAGVVPIGSLAFATRRSNLWAGPLFPTNLVSCREVVLLGLIAARPFL